ncbi:MAG: hypothetical protein EAZ32_11820 [Cytophagia bacterium]|jgi:hypothetical protein|nr:MAG: hypothetical protein EAZ38_12595 [Cytophagales bacterium]TAG38684.1 MAG: hypothetical protein EAZ32_11820 [Cytophagia bacterium]
MTKSFETWEYEEVENTFGLKRVFELSALTEWLNSSKNNIDETMKLFLNGIQKRLIINADAWNEDEFKMFFIAPLLSQMPLEIDDFKPFTQRTLSAKFPELDLEVSGKIEFVIARGKQRPKQPYFFLHEYKQERRRENDPLGQLLISMVAARQNNEKKTPLFGCFVVGRDWFFVVLDQQTYSVSLACDATKNHELYQIVAMLSAMPAIIRRYF